MASTANRPSQSDQEWVKNSKGERVQNTAYKPGSAKKSLSAGKDKLRPNLASRPEPEVEAPSREELLSKIDAEAVDIIADRKARLSAFRDRLNDDPILEGYTVTTSTEERNTTDQNDERNGKFSIGSVIVNGPRGEHLEIFEGDSWATEPGRWNPPGERNGLLPRVTMRIHSEESEASRGFTIDGYANDRSYGEDSRPPTIEMQTTSHGALDQESYAKFAANIAAAAKFHPVAQHVVDEYWNGAKKKR